MSRADKREIEKLQEEVRGSLDSVGGWQKTCLKLEQEAKALQKELHQQKEKYALLLERYIAMMERTVKLDEQRSD
jgi:hypothetical protein